MLLGPPGADIAQERAKGAIECFEKYSGINILDKQWHPSNMSDALKKMEDFIQAYGEDIDAVYTFGCVTAFAAAQALESAGYKPGDVVIATIDLHSEVIKYMEEGWITATIPCQPIKLARSAVLYAAKAVQGEKIPKRIYTGDEIIITIENLKNFDTSDAMVPEGWKPSF